VKLPHILALGFFALAACEPFIEEDVAVGPLPAPPQFSYEILADNPNQVVIRETSTDIFDRVWSIPGARPETSEKALDTIFFPRAGTFTITLNASINGGGTSSASQNIVIEQDGVAPCTDELILLAGGCEESSGKCWTFSHAAGAVTVGPTPGSGEWFRSTSNGLQVDQYDDKFCFYFQNSSFRYLNNGLTIDPFNGYAAVPYNPPTDYTWALTPGGGAGGEVQINLPVGAFLGVWDASNNYDIVVLTETELIVRTPFLNGGGWFELYFEAAD